MDLLERKLTVLRQQKQLLQQEITDNKELGLKVGAVNSYFILFYYGRPPVMLAAGYSVYRCSLDVLSFFFSLPNLRGHLADLHQTLPRLRISMVTQIYKIRSEIWLALPSKF